MDALPIISVILTGVCVAGIGGIFIRLERLAKLEVRVHFIERSVDQLTRAKPVEEVI